MVFPEFMDSKLQITVQLASLLDINYLLHVG